MFPFAPVGVDVDYITECGNDPVNIERAKRIAAEMGDGKLILSVGRTDYTKGGVEQLDSFERLLEKTPELIGKVRLMHVSVSAQCANE